jgi:hypothetical protein
MSAAPPTLGPSQPIPSKPEDVFAFLCALLRDIRAEAQNLQQSLAEIREKAALSDAQARTQAVQAALQEAGLILGRSRTQIGLRLSQIRELFRQSPQQYDWCGDEVTEIENYWERVLVGWPGDTQAPEDALGRVTTLDDPLNQIIFHCESLTIPARLDRYLQNLRVGQPLDFHATFADELPKRAQRQRVLDVLAAQPGVVEGVVEASAGLIYRIAPKAWRRRISTLVIAAAAAAGFLIVWLFAGMGDWLGLADWPVKFADFPRLAVGYLFLIFGSLGHLGINALKQYRSGSSGMVVMEDWLLWLHVREATMVWGILYLWVGFFTLAWTMPGTHWQTFFFAGYSIDSVVDLFLARFQNTVKAKTAEFEAAAK